MKSFIKHVLEDLNSSNFSPNRTIFILPNKRAGVFLKKELSSIIEKPIFSPLILSIEEFVEELSRLKLLSNPELVFKLYQCYIGLTPKDERENFDSFFTWANILLQDFNEIDRHLINQNQIFDYLSAIVELNHWSKTENKTDLIKNYLKFWNKLKEYYLVFTNLLKESNSCYQGLAYREASENLEVYIDNNPNKIHVFLGFNALNKSESIIIQGLLQNDQAYVYWDIDNIFIEDPIHDAGLFIRQHKNSWNYFKKHSFNWLSNNYSKEKNVEVVGIPKLVGQAKYIGQLLDKLQITKGNFSDIAVVLGEENLLLPLLNSLPESVDKLNVTMGLSLKFIPIASGFDALLLLHKNKASSFYYKDVLSILRHPAFYQLFSKSSGNTVTEISKHIQTNNLSFVTSKKLKEIAKDDHDLLGLFFDNWNDTPNLAIDNCLDIIGRIKKSIDSKLQLKDLELEYLFRFYSLFNQLKTLNNQYPYLNSISGLQVLYKELLNTETLDFKGEPLEGLQIMGMLESRVLDFETVIISSVNEGILPSGKSNNSFIPFDVKIENGLPTFKEKDAVYTYHFYHLLQRAKNVYILYNTENDALNGGEKSRFITQLEVEGIHKIKHVIASPQIPTIKYETLTIQKTELVLEAIKKIASEGFSPSSLSNYIRNPIDFYFEKILGIKEFEDVEENIAANTLGSVIHQTLEDFYKPIEGEFLSVEYLESRKNLIEKTVTRHFKSLFKEGDFSKGKNLIIYNIAQHYINAFIENEIKSLNAGNEIKIIAIEAKTFAILNIDGLDFPIKIKGTVDRVDEFNGVTRIIDYKTGKVEQGKVEIVNWEDITTDYDKFSKSFQVLCYAYMLNKQKDIQLPVEAGIISFKNLKNGFLKFGTKASSRGRVKDQLITDETLSNFESELIKLVKEICNCKVNFIEKEVS